MAAAPVLRQLHQRLPDSEIIVSVTTPGGHEVASKMLGEIIKWVIYTPFDTPDAVLRAVKTVQPDVFVNMETEIWPNLLYAVKRFGARSLLINGRISDKSIGAYKRFRPLFRWALSHFDRILVQTALDAERFIEIGSTPDKVEVAGNAKFDDKTELLTAEQVTELRSELKLPEGAPVLVVGSTRSAEEERAIFTAVCLVRKEIPDLALVHAPRHIDRAAEVAGIMRQAGLSPVRRTELKEITVPVTELILDTFGELARVYAVGAVSYAGNSLISGGTGQSPLQALAQGKPVLFGPYMSDQRDLAAMAAANNVGFEVHSAEELASKIVELVRNKPELEAIKTRALKLIQANMGAALRYTNAVIKELQGKIAG